MLKKRMCAGARMHVQVHMRVRGHMQTHAHACTGNDNDKGEKCEGTEQGGPRPGETREEKKT